MLLMSVFSVAVHAHLLLISWEAAFGDRTTGSSALEGGVMGLRQSASGVSLSDGISPRNPEFV